MSNVIEESHGWFPSSAKMNNPMMSPVEGTLPDPVDYQRNNKKKLLIRRPSGLEISSISSDESSPMPVITSPDTVTGIKRLPTSTIKKQDSLADVGTKAVNYQPTSAVRIPQAKSSANLPVKTMAQLGVKRVQSSSSVSRTAQENKGGQNLPSKSSVVRIAPRKGKLQKSLTTPGRIEDQEMIEESHKRKQPSAAAAATGNGTSKKVK